MNGFGMEENASQQGGSSWDSVAEFGGPPGFDASAAPARSQAPQGGGPVSTDERSKMVAMYWRRLAGLRPHRSFATRYIQTLDKFMCAPPHPFPPALKAPSRLVYLFLITPTPCFRFLLTTCVAHAARGRTRRRLRTAG